MLSLAGGPNASASMELNCTRVENLEVQFAQLLSQYVLETRLISLSACNSSLLAWYEDETCRLLPTCVTLFGKRTHCTGHVTRSLQRCKQACRFSRVLNQQEPRNSAPQSRSPEAEIDAFGVQLPDMVGSDLKLHVMARMVEVAWVIAACWRWRPRLRGFIEWLHS